MGWVKIPWFGPSDTPSNLIVNTFRIRQFYTKQISNDFFCNLGVQKLGHRSERQAATLSGRLCSTDVRLEVVGPRNPSREAARGWLQRLVGLATAQTTESDLISLPTPPYQYRRLFNLN